jgi:polyphosphate kinase
MNALVDPGIIRALYDASRAGVRVDLNVRGICCLRPGVPGVSEHIRVVSNLGRFLEHPRIYAFERGAASRCYIGSADMMPRNLDHRVEILAPVEDPALAAQVKDVVERCMVDTSGAWELGADGTWRRRTATTPHDKRSAQGELMERAVRMVQMQSGRPVA